MIKPMNVTTFGALSVAHYVALRELGDSEIEAIRQNDSNTLARVSKVMSRISFVDELRYSVQLDLTDMFQCMNRNALETYLLCTCFDTLSGKDNYLDLQGWLRAGRVSSLGISERQALLQVAESKMQTLLGTSFSEALSNILDINNKHYGINQNIKQLIQALPEETKNDIAKAYTIYKESASDCEKTWREKNVNDKLKTIFIDYLFQYRCNLYTHESQDFPDFGGIRTMREALREGNIELPSAERHHFSMEKGFLLVTCHYGDEALFLRETLLTCLAHKLNVLNAGWSERYGKAERQKRMLYALLYELKHNIQVLQLHLQVLSEPLLLSFGKDDGSPKLETRISQTVLEKNRNEGLPVWDHLIESYIQSVLEFNVAIDKTGADIKHHMETTSQIANSLMMESKVRWRGQELGRYCMQLLEDYPEWTYATGYFPSQSL
jgi:hypothetical protein